MRYQRTTGLALTQMEELVARVHAALEVPWNMARGRRKKCGLYQAVEITCMYIRHNSTQEFIGDLRGVSQPTVSRIQKVLEPAIRDVLQEFVPSPEDAIEMVSGRACLVDGTITPCWSYAEHAELWSRKRGTTGFSSQLVTLLSGDPVYISDPFPGSTHDAVAFEESPVKQIVERSGGGIGDKGYQGTGLATPRKRKKGWDLGPRDKQCNAEVSAMRAPVERTIAHFKSWKTLHTDYRRNHKTYRQSFEAARALFFFSLTCFE